MGTSIPSRPRSRFWSSARVAMTAGRTAARQLLGRADAERDAALGRSLAGQLDDMKGLAMKVGQIVSYLDVPLPSEVRHALETLQQGVRGLPFDEVRALVEAELGQPLESSFERFDPDPVAAASVGQVHRARVLGTEVAVKVRYPGIDQSFRSDLAAIHRLAGLASLGSAVDARAVVGELAERMAEEADYAREARFTAAFARAFRSTPRVRVPTVVPERSSSAVLTSHWVTGRTFQQFAAEASPRAIHDAAQTLVSFTYRSLFELATIQADPHPGNFLFPEDDDAVVFLDYGCVRELPQDHVIALRDQARAVLDQDRIAFRDASIRMGVVGKPRRFDFEHYYEVIAHLYRPFTDPDFRFDAQYVKMAYAQNGPSSPNARTLAMPPALMWVQRLQWGLASVLARLGAHGDFRPVFRTHLEAPVRPMSTIGSESSEEKLAS